MFGYRVSQVLTLQPLVTEQAVGVPVRAVAEDRDDGVIRPQFLRDLLGRDDVQGAAGPQVQTFLVQAAVHHLDALLVGDLQRAVDLVHFDFHVLRHTALADAFSDAAAASLLELPARGHVGVEDRSGRVGQEGLDRAVADVLQEPGDAGQGAPRARCAGEGVDFAVGLSPDFRARGLNVCPSVRDVVELVRPYRAVLGIFLLQSFRVSFGLPVVVLRVLPRNGRDRIHFGAQQSQQVDLALRLCVGHVDDQFVAFCSADVRQADPSIAGGALDDCPSRFQQASLFRILNHV